MIDIAIIVNSFNRFALLKQAINVIQEWISTSCFKNRIIIVVYDAGSKDGSVEWLTEQSLNLSFPLKLIQPFSDDDTSFAAGINVAVSFAKNHYPFIKYLLFYETDNQMLSATPLEQAIAVLDQTSRLAACGFTVRKVNGDPAGVGMPFPKIIHFVLGRHLVHQFQFEAINYKWTPKMMDSSFSYIDVVYTSPLLVRVDAWLETGGLDSERFPFSDCDIDWARQLNALGWQMGVIKTDDVIHDNQESLSAWSKTRSLQTHRSRLRYFKKHSSTKMYTFLPLILMLRHLFELVIIMICVQGKTRRANLKQANLILLKKCFTSYE